MRPSPFPLIVERPAQPLAGRLTPPLNRADFDCLADFLEWARRAGYDPEDLPLGPAIPVPRRKTERSDLSTPDFQKLHRAAALANIKGCNLGVMATISWGTVGIVDDDEIVATRQDQTQKLTKWLHHKMPHSAFLWVDERGKHLGRHTHLLVHVPPEHDLPFRRWLEKSLTTTVGRALVDHVSVGGGRQVSTLHIGPNGGRNVRRQWRAFRYLMKGIGPSRPIPYPGSPHGKFLLREFARIRVADQGAIRGQRCGTSQDINRSGEAAIIARLGRAWYERLCIAPDPSVIAQQENPRRHSVPWFLYKDFACAAEIQYECDRFCREVGLEIGSLG